MVYISYPAFSRFVLGNLERRLVLGGLGGELSVASVRTLQAT